MNQFFSSGYIVSPWTRHFYLISFVAITAVHALACGALYWSIHSQEEVVILRYNAYLGVDLLGVWWQLFLIPAVSYFFILINFLLIQILNSRQYNKLSLLLILGSWLVTGSSVVAILALSFINV